jgi:hypothetical protein
LIPSLIRQIDADSLQTFPHEEIDTLLKITIQQRFDSDSPFGLRGLGHKRNIITISNADAISKSSFEDIEINAIKGLPRLLKQEFLEVVIPF